MGRRGSFPDEFRERAVRLVREWRRERRATRRTVRDAAWRSTRRPSGSTKIGPWARSPTARSIGPSDSRCQWQGDALIAAVVPRAGTYQPSDALIHVAAIHRATVGVRSCLEVASQHEHPRG
jgi:hypothetical protein